MTLSRKLTLATAAFAALVSLAIGGIELWRKHVAELHNIDKQFAQIESSSVPPIAETVWSMNRLGAELIAEGIARHPDVARVTITSADETIVDRSVLQWVDSLPCRTFFDYGESNSQGRGRGGGWRYTGISAKECCRNRDSRWLDRSNPMAVMNGLNAPRSTTRPWRPSVSAKSCAIREWSALAVRSFRAMPSSLPPNRCRWTNSLSMVPNASRS